MDSNTSVTIMFISVATAVGGIVLAILNYSLKIKIIKSGKVDDNAIKLLTAQNSDSHLTILKWGLILLMGGLGLIVLEFLPYSANSPLPYGLEGIFLAIGLLLYYKISIGHAIHKSKNNL